MNNIVKITLTALTLAALTGCTSVPQAPKDAKEMAEWGEDNLLNVPVDITPFLNTARKVKIVSEEDKYAGLFGFGRDGDVGQTTIFTNPEDGKMYDADGQPVNEKGERILKNGYVCKVRMIAGNKRYYAKPSFTQGMFATGIGMNDCRSKISAEYIRNSQKVMVGAVAAGIATGGAGYFAVVGGTMAATQAIANIIQDDTM